MKRTIFFCLVFIIMGFFIGCQNSQEPAFVWPKKNIERLSESDHALYIDGDLVLPTDAMMPGSYLFSDLTAGEHYGQTMQTRRGIEINRSVQAVASAYKNIPCVVYSDYGKEYCESMDAMLRENALITGAEDGYPKSFAVSFSSRFLNETYIDGDAYRNYLKTIGISADENDNLPESAGDVHAYIIAFDINDNIVTDILIVKK